jgi:hypothetical protein
MITRPSMRLRRMTRSPRCCWAVSLVQPNPRQRIDKGVMTAISNRIVRIENMAFDCAGVASTSVRRAPTPQRKSEVLINAYQKRSRSEDYDRLMIQWARSQVADHALNRFRLSATIRQVSSFDAEIS